MLFDILIKNGSVVDGTGNNLAYKTDIGINGDKIFDIGDLSRTKGVVEIDAAGLVVSPGFIDVQNHSDSYGSLLRDPHLESLVRQGITTILIGQCGSSLAPLLKGSLASMQKWTAMDGFNVNWKSMAEFLEAMSKRPNSVNIATLVGHATLRRDFLGDSTRPLLPKEEQQLGMLLKRSLHEGARGLSVGLAYSHERLTTDEEIHKLLKITHDESGVASFHLRDEGAKIFAAVNEVIGFLRHNPVKSKISHLKILGERNITATENLLKMLDIAFHEGLPVYFDVYPYLVSAVVLYLLLPEWAILGGRDQLVQRINTTEIRNDIVRDMAAKNYPYDKITVATASLGVNFIGKSIAQIAKDQGVSEAEAVLNLILASRGQIVVFWNDLEERSLEELIKHPLAIIASDSSGYNLVDRFSSLPHPRSFGTTAQVLGYYVRERKILSLEEAVYKMTGLPANWLGLVGRGIIAKNNYADIAIFNPKTIRSLSGYDNPFKYPQGIDYVLVNGKITVKKGEYKNQLSGQVLRKI